MATGNDDYVGRHEAEPTPEIVAQDESTGTPPHIPAGVRSAVYIGLVVVNVLAFLLLGILPALGIMDRAVAAEVGLTVITALDMLGFGLAVGYRPTRPGSPVA